MVPVAREKQYEYDTKILRVVREIAINLHDIETILKHNQITPERWLTIQSNPHFLRLLETETAAWNSAGNTHERTRLKAAALMEEWLCEANTRMHDPEETLSAKVELGKLLTKIAEMGTTTPGQAAIGERFSVTINLGADHKLQFEKDVTPRVIDVTPTKES